MFIASLGGCSVFHRTPPPPPAPPAMDVEVAPFIGSPLSGPTTQPTPNLSAADAIQIDIDWIALQKFPGDELLPLDAQSNLTSAPLTAGPILTVGQSTRLIRFGQGDRVTSFTTKVQSGALGPMIQAGHQTGLIAPGTTARFSNVLPRAADKTARVIVLSIGRSPTSTASAPTTAPTSAPTTQPADGIMSIGVEGLSTPAAVIDTTNDAGPKKPPSAAPPGMENAFLDKLSFSDGDHFAILFPCTIQGTPWNALAASITIHAVAADADGAASIESLRKDLTDAGNRARAGIPLPPPANVQELQSAIASLNRHGSLRPPLLFLCTNTGAQVAADFVLVADDAMLGQLRDQLLASQSGKKNPPVPADLSWTLDRTSLLLMTGAAAKNNLPPEVASVMVLHAGEVGRHPDSLEDITKAVGNSADLKLRLIAENFIALEDNSPSARVRAYDWLQAQGKAPAGFDPLADRKSRRDAINKALAANGGGQ